MKTTQGDLISLARDGEFDLIVDGCNCFGTMGAGIAKGIKAAFPQAFEADRATAKGNKAKLGTCSFAEIVANGKTVIVINAYDFNLAFDEEFDRGRFFGVHVFSGMLKKWPDGFRERLEPRMRQALGQVRAIFSELPQEWLHVDGDDSLPVQLDEKRVTSVLELPFTNPDRFWKLP